MSFTSSLPSSLLIKDGKINGALHRKSNQPTVQPPFSSSSLLDLKEISKRVKGRGKKELLYPIFIECSKLVTDSFWRVFYEDLAFNKCPRTVFITNKSVCSNHKKNPLSYSFDNKKATEIIKELYPLLLDKTNVCSQADWTKKKMMLEKSQQLQSKKEYARWSSIRKKAIKDALIIDFVVKEKNLRGLNWAESRELRTLVTTSLTLSIIESTDVLYEDGEIKGIKCLVYNPNTRKYDIKKPIKNGGRISSNVSENNGIQCSLVWNKFVENYDKAVKTLLKN